MNNIFPILKDFFIKNEQKIILIIGFVLISAISFEFGVLQGQKWQQKPLIIEKPVNTLEEGRTGQNEASGAPQKQLAPALPTKTSSGACAYVGSKNSTKFYLPSCSYAKRIKPENVVCFKSAQEALGQGRTESKCN